MHSNVSVKYVNWPHFSWATLYIKNCYCQCVSNYLSYISAKYYLNWFTFGKVIVKVKRVTLKHNVDCFLQRGRIACNAERCNNYGNSVRPSLYPSHASTLSR